MERLYERRSELRRKEDAELRSLYTEVKANRELLDLHTSQINGLKTTVQETWGYTLDMDLHNASLEERSIYRVMAKDKLEQVHDRDAWSKRFVIYIGATSAAGAALGNIPNIINFIHTLGH